jgi:hypothetical protein
MRWIWAFGITGFGTLFWVNVVWRWWITGTAGGVVGVILLLCFFASAVGMLTQ